MRDLLVGSEREMVVVGDVMLDEFVYGTVDRLCPEAPVPVLRPMERAWFPGGAANVAANVEALGVDVLLVGVVGADRAADILRERLADAGVRHCLLVDADRPTTTKKRFIADGQLLIRVDHEVCEPIGTRFAEQLLQIARDVVGDAGACALSDYAKGVLSPSVLRSLIEVFRREGRAVVADPKSPCLGRYSGATVVAPNLAEARAAAKLPPEAPLEAVGQALLTQVGEGTAVLVTQGAAGMTLFAAGARSLHLPADRRLVSDITGAGDTVVATLGAVLASGGDLVDACRLANRAAGIVVEKPGVATTNLTELFGQRGGAGLSHAS